MESIESQGVWLDCACHDSAHSIQIEMVGEDEKLEPTELCIHTRLRYWQGFFRRIWNAICYILKKDCRFGEFDTFMTSSQSKLEAIRDAAQGVINSNSEKNVAEKLFGLGATALAVRADTQGSKEKTTKKKQLYCASYERHVGEDETREEYLVYADSLESAGKMADARLMALNANGDPEAAVMDERGDIILFGGEVGYRRRSVRMADEERWKEQKFQDSIL